MNGSSPAPQGAGVALVGTSCSRRDAETLPPVDAIINNISELAFLFDAKIRWRKICCQSPGLDPTGDRRTV